MMKPRIRTLLIDDSAFMRKVIADIINTEEEIDLVGTASNGKEGSSMAMSLKPDVVITDMVMPEYDGLYLVREVMQQQPVPIILLSSLEKTNSRIFDALQFGAFEFIDKPTDLDMSKIKEYPLISLIREASRTDISLLKARQIARQNNESHTFDDKLNYQVIVIGASTGGPGALEGIIRNLPSNLQIPVVIAQHMPARFLETFAQRINELSRIPVKLAHKGEMLKGGVIYIAPGEANMKIERSIIDDKPIIHFTNKQYKEFNNPSIDCLFESAALAYGSKVIGVVLTGMGKDGTHGLLTIKQKGGYTIAQDEESSIVYGMPKAAFESGAVNQVVKLKEIPGYLVSCL